MNRLTVEQYEALEIFIVHFRHATVRAKQVVLWFLAQSRNLEQNIAVTIPYRSVNTADHKLALEVADAVHNLNSSAFQPMIQDVFTLAEMEKRFIFSGGVAEQVGHLVRIKDEQDQSKRSAKRQKGSGYTIILCSSNDEQENEPVKLLEFDKAAAEKMKLRNAYFKHSYSADKHMMVPEFYGDTMQNITTKIPEELLKITAQIAGKK